MTNRREFLAAGAAGLLAGARSLGAFPLNMPVGTQTYPVAKVLGADFDGTLKKIAAIGYKTIEMCSPPGYVSSGFGPLANMPAKEMRKHFQAAGLTCESSHYGAREFRENLDERIAFAKELGLKQMVLSSFGLPKEAKMADWRRAAEDLNKAGEKIKKAGLQTGFHNHHMEFATLDGVLIYDELMKVLDPKIVKMQFQVAVISIGFEAATYMEKYPGRFISLHLADWSATEKKGVPVGKGVVDWKKLFATAKKGGVKNYYVEMDWNAMEASVPFLRDLKV